MPNNHITCYLHCATSDNIVHVADGEDEESVFEVEPKTTVTLDIIGIVYEGYGVEFGLYWEVDAYSSKIEASEGVITNENGIYFEGEDCP
jgi:hypothetical protein